MPVYEKASPNALQWAGEDIVEYTLLLCAVETTFDDLIQPTILKKYLFYLIDYDLILYSGQKQVYLIKDKGLELLSRIIMENKAVWS
jgi:hypothetical protein